MKKTLLFLFIILLVLSIGTVNATNNNTTIEEPIILAKEPKSMMDLQYEIYNSTNELILDCDYEFTKEDLKYGWSGKYIVEYGVMIDKDLVIDGRGHTINGHLKVRLLQVSETANVVLKNIYFMNGIAYDTLDDTGGAVLNKGTKYLSINNCTFDNNRAIIGGALNNAHIINCKFIDNKADYGGAIYSSSDNLQILYSEFINNTANNGGAVYASNNARIKECIFKNNVAKDNLIMQNKGGAIQCEKNLEIDGCVFGKNHADDYGGAVYADTITFTNVPSHFYLNSVDDNQGGAIYTNKFETDLFNITFVGNSANNDGGAIYINDENHITFHNCYFENNRCGNKGGAIYLDSKYSHLTLINNDFINNTASNEGQTIFNKGYYEKVSNNYWGNNIPSTNNDQLVEWKLWTKNIKHTDNNPLNSYLNQTITFNVNNISYDRTIDSNDGIVRLNVRVPNQMSIDRIPERIFIIDPPTVTIPLPPSMVTPLENRTITHIYKNVSLNNIEWLLKPLKASNIPEYIPPTKPKEPLNITFPVDPITQMLNWANEVKRWYQIHYWWMRINHVL